MVRPACFSGRCPVAGRYTRLNAYGRVRTSDPSKLSTDRTYDPALGTFLSPDTLVPERGCGHRLQPVHVRAGESAEV